MHRITTLRRALLGTMLVAALCCSVGGCSDPATCAGVGESCQVFCCSNLTCHVSATGGYCTRGCRCHGSSICAPTTFDEGCPQGSACLAKASDGTGECVRLCDSSPCKPGEVLCDNANDAGIACQVIPPPDLSVRGD